MSQGITRLAVVLRGHIRTWYQFAERNFAHFDRISPDVDYYAVLWDQYTDEELQRLKDSFTARGQNITLNVMSVDYTGKYNSYVGPANMTKLVSKEIMLEHNINPYDAIIDTRFDISYNWHHNPVPIQPDVNMIQTSGFTLQPCPNKGINIIGTEDHYFMFSPENLQLMYDRITWPMPEHNSHYTIYKYLEMHGKYLNKIANYDAVITRPDQVEEMEYNTTDMAKPIPFSQWHILERSRRKQYLDEFNIRHSDYITGHSAISVEDAIPGC